MGQNAVMFFYYHNRKRGFTVIEIFIIVSIIAILAAVSIYYYNDYIEDSKLVVRTTNIKSINEALSLYYKEHMEYPVYDWQQDDIDAATNNNINKGLDSALSKYLTNGKVSDLLREAANPDEYEIYYRVTTRFKRNKKLNDYATDSLLKNDYLNATGTWKLASNLRFIGEKHFVKEIAILPKGTYDDSKILFTLKHGTGTNTDTNTSTSTGTSTDTNTDITMEMRLIPPGSFLMGSPASPPELGRVGNEYPHPVTITKMFYMAKYEVTQAQYEAVMGVNPSYFKGDLSRPVEKVSYIDAKNFCNALNTRLAGLIPDGYKFDLPTEAQWEYACRAGTTTSLNNGHNITTTQRMEYCPYTDEVAWYAYNSGGKIHPVGTKKPNAFGLYDMHSNLFEWVRDWYQWNVTDEIDPEGPETGTTRVYKGGCWNDGPNQLRSAYRLNRGESHSSQHIGFRVALVPIKDDN